MIRNEYPEHDMNKVFDYIYETLSVGDCDDKAIKEAEFLNKLFAALPAEAVEYGMQFLNHKTDLPKNCEEILPLYIRFVSLVEYCEKIVSLRLLPNKPTTEQIMERSKTLSSLSKHEEAFIKPLLGLKASDEAPSQIDTTKIKEDAAEDASKAEPSQDSSALHLMNSCAPVFVCDDILKTSLFYEQKCGFKATHLSDEKLPHIRLSRDNIEIVLTEGKTIVMHSIAGIDYDMYIYVAEPYLLCNELTSAGVKIISDLPDAETAVKSTLNREFVFEDNDGRYICVSQRTVW